MSRRQSREGSIIQNLFSQLSVQLEKDQEIKNLVLGAVKPSSTKITALESTPLQCWRDIDHCWLEIGMGNDSIFNDSIFCNIGQRD